MSRIRFLPATKTKNNLSHTMRVKIVATHEFRSKVTRVIYRARITARCTDKSINGKQFLMSRDEIQPLPFQARQVYVCSTWTIFRKKKFPPFNLHQSDVHEYLLRIGFNFFSSRPRGHGWLRRRATLLYFWRRACHINRTSKRRERKREKTYGT